MKRKLVDQTIIDTVRKCSLERGMSDAQIAKQINLSVPTVRKIRKNSGIEKNQAGKVISSPEYVSSFQESKNSSYATDAEKRNAVYIAFKGTQRYHKLVSKYEPDDLENFVQSWIDYQLVLPDMTVAEEDMLETLLDIKHRMDENQKSMKMMRKQQNLVILDIQKNEPIDLSNDNHRALFEMAQGLEQKFTDLNKTFKDLGDQFKSAQASLHVSREQREKQQKIGGDVFLSLVKKFNDNDARARIGDRNELLKLTTKNKTDKLKKPITFDDGTHDPILMSGKDAQKTEEK
jgi:hypothetical protein